MPVFSLGEDPTVLGNNLRYANADLDPSGREWVGASDADIRRLIAIANQACSVVLSDAPPIIRENFPENIPLYISRQQAFPFAALVLRGASPKIAYKKRADGRFYAENHPLGRLKGIVVGEEDLAMEDALRTHLGHEIFHVAAPATELSENLNEALIHGLENLYFPSNQQAILSEKWDTGGMKAPTGLRCDTGARLHSMQHQEGLYSLLSLSRAWLFKNQTAAEIWNICADVETHARSTGVACYATEWKTLENAVRRNLGELQAQTILNSPALKPMEPGFHEFVLSQKPGDADALTMVYNFAIQSNPNYGTPRTSQIDHVQYFVEGRNRYCDFIGWDEKKRLMAASRQLAPTEGLQFSTVAHTFAMAGVPTDRLVRIECMTSENVFVLEKNPKEASQV